MNANRRSFVCSLLAMIIAPFSRLLKRDSKPFRGDFLCIHKQPSLFSHGDRILFLEQTPLWTVNRDTGEVKFVGHCINHVYYKLNESTGNYEVVEYHETTEPSDAPKYITGEMIG